VDNKGSNLFNFTVENTKYLYKDSYHSILYLMIFGKLIPNFFIIISPFIFLVISDFIRTDFNIVDTFSGLEIGILSLFCFDSIFTFLGYYLIKPYVYQIVLKDNNLIISSVEYKKKREDTIDLLTTTIGFIQSGDILGITRDYAGLPYCRIQLKQDKKIIFEIKNFQGFFFGLRKKEVSALYKQLMILQKSLKNKEENDQLTEV
jgi:hypothetical protein